MRAAGCTTLQIIFNLFRQDYVDRSAARARRSRMSASSSACRWPAGCCPASGPRTTVRRDRPPHLQRQRREVQCRRDLLGPAVRQGRRTSPTSSSSWRPRACQLSQFALRWLLDQPAVSTIIAGVTRPDQLKDNVAAARIDPLEPALHRGTGGLVSSARCGAEVRGRI